MGNKAKQAVETARCNLEQSNEAALAMIYIGIVMIGVGHSMPFTLGVPLIDDNVKKQNAPLYFGSNFFY